MLIKHERLSRDKVIPDRCKLKPTVVPKAVTIYSEQWEDYATAVTTDIVVHLGRLHLVHATREESVLLAAQPGS